MSALAEIVKALWEQPGRTRALAHGLKLRLVKGRIRKKDRTFITGTGKHPTTAFCLLAWADRAVERKEINVLIRHAKEGLQAPKPLAVKEIGTNRWAIIWDVRPPKPGKQGKLL